MKYPIWFSRIRNGLFIIIGVHVIGAVLINWIFSIGSLPVYLNVFQALYYVPALLVEEIVRMVLRYRLSNDSTTKVCSVITVVGLIALHVAVIFMVLGYGENPVMAQVLFESVSIYFPFLFLIYVVDWLFTSERLRAMQ